MDRRAPSPRALPKAPPRARAPDISSCVYRRRAPRSRCRLAPRPSSPSLPSRRRGAASPLIVRGDVEKDVEVTVSDVAYDGGNHRVLSHQVLGITDGLRKLGYGYASVGTHELLVLVVVVDGVPRVMARLPEALVLLRGAGDRHVALCADIVADLLSDLDLVGDGVFAPPVELDPEGGLLREVCRPVAVDRPDALCVDHLEACQV